MNLVVGATGRLGSAICRLLAAQGKPIRALVRSVSDPAAVRALRELGAELVYGDLRDQGSLETACQDVRAVISTASAVPRRYEWGVNDVRTVDLEGLTHLIAAAQAADVPRLVYVSLSGHLDLDFPLRNAKRAIERRLRDSGLVYTALRPSYFMEAWLSPALGFDVAKARARIYGSGEHPISWISLQDVARFAAACLDHPAARYACLELGGPEALGPLQVVRIFEQIGGTAFAVRHVPEEALREQQEKATDPMQQSLAGLMRCYARGDPIDMQETLAVFPMELVSVTEYAQRVIRTT
jgi:uncharacterized protein YbjT (DUF2867 family)